MRPVSRTRCSVPAMQSIVRYDAPQSRDPMDPGSVAHRHSASKTRVNALMALRSVRGTRTSSWTWRSSSAPRTEPAGRAN